MLHQHSMPRRSGIRIRPWPASAAAVSTAACCFCIAITSLPHASMRVVSTEGFTSLGGIGNTRYETYVVQDRIRKTTGFAKSMKDVNAKKQRRQEDGSSATTAAKQPEELSLHVCAKCVQKLQKKGSTAFNPLQALTVLAKESQSGLPVMGAECFKYCKKGPNIKLMRPVTRVSPALLWKV